MSVTPSKQPAWFTRMWDGYKRITGFERADLQRKTGLKIRSTAFPIKPISRVK